MQCILPSDFAGLAFGWRGEVILSPMPVSSFDSNKQRYEIKNSARALVQVLTNQAAELARARIGQKLFSSGVVIIARLTGEQCLLSLGFSIALQGAWVVVVRREDRLTSRFGTPRILPLASSLQRHRADDLRRDEYGSPREDSRYLFMAKLYSNYI